MSVTQRPHIVLGLSGSHDTGAVILKDGRLVAAMNEERLSRIKQAVGAPHLSLPAVIEQAGITAGDIDRVAMAGQITLGDMPDNADLSLADGTYGKPQLLAEFLDSLPLVSPLMRTDAAIAGYRAALSRVPQKREAEVRQLLAKIGVRPGVIDAMARYDHHDCHVASAYYASGEPDCLIISNDAFGDGLCCKVAVGEGGKLRTISQNGFFNSIGCYYSYATSICGFSKAHHAGKTTGLAAFGSSDATIDVFRRLFDWDESRGIYVNKGPLFGRALRLMAKELKGVSREDVAAGAQRHIQEILVKMTRHFMRVTGKTKIVLVGGIHANVRANQCIAEIPGVESIFVYPNMGDGGLPVGAAWLNWAENNASVPMPPRIDHVYLGSKIGRDDAAVALQDKPLVISEPANLAHAVAERLAANKIVARASGAMEFGPRALGNRSILYAATDRKVNKWLNDRLKRTEFMPFAPVCRDVDAPLFFEGVSEQNLFAAEFMTITFGTTARCKQEAPAIVHVDGTARPQIIRREINPEYYDILTEYNRLTGLSILVNTSFNMHEEPIVRTAEEAVAAFFASKIDSLVMGPFLADNRETFDLVQPK